MSSSNDFEEKISSCQRENNWGTPGDLCLYEGLWYSEHFVKGVMAAQENFEAKSTDIFLASHPKTGATWLKALAFTIATRNAFSVSPLLTKGPHDCIPFFETDLCEKSTTSRDNQSPLIATHVSYTSLPKSVKDSNCKIVYIWRDAKDVFVSLWYFKEKLNKSWNSSEPPVPMEEAFEQFCKGISPYGPYWDHVLGYWKAKLEFPDKILFLKYEEIKKDTRFWVKQLAEFMGYPFSMEEEENGVVEKIISLCSFDHLSNLEVNKTGRMCGHKTSLVFHNNTFFRKGEIGDWMNVLTSEMGARLDSIMDRQLKDSGLLN